MPRLVTVSWWPFVLLILLLLLLLLLLLIPLVLQLLLLLTAPPPPPLPLLFLWFLNLNFFLLFWFLNLNFYLIGNSEVVGFVEVQRDSEYGIFFVITVGVAKGKLWKQLPLLIPQRQIVVAGSFCWVEESTSEPPSRFPKLEPPWNLSPIVKALKGIRTHLGPRRGATKLESIK